MGIRKNFVVQVYFKSQRELEDVRVRAMSTGKKISTYLRDLAIIDMYSMGMRGMLDTKENMDLMKRAQKLGEEDSSRFLRPDLPEPSREQIGFDHDSFLRWQEAQNQPTVSTEDLLKNLDEEDDS